MNHDIALKFINKELDKIAKKKELLFSNIVVSKNRARRYKRIKRMEDNLHEAYKNLRRYERMAKFIN